MSVSRRTGLAALVALGLAFSLAACVERPERSAQDRHLARIRAGKARDYEACSALYQLRDDRVIDALVELVAHGEGQPRVQAAAALGYPHVSTAPDWPQRGTDPRALGDDVLPARIAPALLAAMSGDEPGLRAKLLLALASIDEPTPAVVAVVRGALTDDDPRVAEAAVIAAGMLGVHAAEAAGDLERLPDAGGPVRRVSIAGALARASGGAHVRALGALLSVARGDDAEAATLAVTHLRDIGSRAGMAGEGLMAILHEKSLERPAVAEAVVAISPDSFEDVLALLVDAAASADRMVAMFADAEIDRLARGRPGEMRAAIPALAAALDARSVNDGVRLSGTLRRLNTRRGRKAYNSRIHRQRAEAAENGRE